MESKSQQYINEMEKNSKLFEEKLNKFKKYQTSEAYTQQSEFEEKESEDFHQINRFSKKMPLNQEKSENSEEEYYSKSPKNKNKNSIPSSKKITKKNIYSNKDDYYEEDEIENKNYNQKRKNFNSLINI